MPIGITTPVVAQRDSEDLPGLIDRAAKEALLESRAVRVLFMDREHTPGVLMVMPDGGLELHPDPHVPILQIAEKDSLRAAFALGLARQLDEELESPTVKVICRGKTPGHVVITADILSGEAGHLYADAQATRAFAA